MPLKSRQLFIPGGFKFYVPQTKWQPSPNSSFDSIVQQVVAHRNGNPHLRDKFKWSVDPNVVAVEVDNFNTEICKRMGWTDYITEGGGPQALPFQPSQPASQPSQFQKLGNVAAGSEILVEWISSGAEAVAVSVSNARALRCSVCPANEQVSDWTSIFTVPVSEAIRRELNRRKDMALSTAFDDKLGVCSACNCPLKLKVHVPLKSIVEKMPKESVDALDKNCWILSEAK